jgi:NAD(P)-dependent dehydrogenase (short-subunit alcohol dehydrogenase family)
MAYNLDLSHRTALVTGAGQGVGRGIAEAMAAAGADVIVNDLDPQRATAVAEQIRDQGGSASVRTFDVTDDTAIAAALEGAGTIDVLVNNAGNAGSDGLPSSTSFSDSQRREWDSYISVNLYGVLNCSHSVLPGMIGNGWGRIITISSDAARAGGGPAVYAAAKAGAAGFSRILAQEVGRHDITVNSISLGAIHTEATDRLWADPDSDLARKIMKSYVIRRPGRPDDVAALATFLASDHAGWITGQTYALNGGFSFSL